MHFRNIKFFIFFVETCIEINFKRFEFLLIYQGKSTSIRKVMHHFMWPSTFISTATVYINFLNN